MVFCCFTLIQPATDCPYGITWQSCGNRQMTNGEVEWLVKSSVRQCSTRAPFSSLASYYCTIPFSCHTGPGKVLMLSFQNYGLFPITWGKLFRSYYWRLKIRKLYWLSFCNSKISKCYINTIVKFFRFINADPQMWKLCPSSIYVNVLLWILIKFKLRDEETIEQKRCIVLNTEEMRKKELGQALKRCILSA